MSSATIWTAGSVILGGEGDASLRQKAEADVVWSERARSQRTPPRLPSQPDLHIHYLVTRVQRLFSSLNSLIKIMEDWTLAPWLQSMNEGLC